MPLNLFFKIISTSSFAWLNTDLYSNEKKKETWELVYNAFTKTLFSLTEFSLKWKIIYKKLCSIPYDNFWKLWNVSFDQPWGIGMLLC